VSGAGAVGSTLSCEQAAERAWDVGIIGAGVAGASLAIRLARKGLSVLLIEAQKFPREKVCGGCLNQRAIASLAELGVLADCQAAGAVPIQWLRIRQFRRDHRWRFPEMLSIRRSTLDSLLVQAAIDSGAAYLDQTTATLDEAAEQGDCEVRLQLRSETANPDGHAVPGVRVAEVRVSAAVVAAGLTRSPLVRRAEWPAEIAHGSRIGVQSLVPAELLERQAWSWSEGLQLSSPDELRMLVGSSGYLGISRTDGSYFDLAAAVDPEAVRKHKSIGLVIDQLLGECGLPPLGELNPQRWASTPHLTRASWPVARNRVFLIGDAMGYVEPFTGEGMSWGLAGARQLSDLLREALADSTLSGSTAGQSEARWNAWAMGQRRRNQSICRWVAGQVRHPVRAAWLLNGLDWFPPVRNMILRKATR